MRIAGQSQRVESKSIVKKLLEAVLFRKVPSHKVFKDGKAYVKYHKVRRISPITAWTILATLITFGALFLVYRVGNVMVANLDELADSRATE